MRLELEVELPDAPGQLSRVLEIVADHGANVVSVVHRHEEESDGRVPVLLQLEVEERETLGLVDAIARDHRLLSIDRHGGPVRTAVLLVGHVFEADLRELLEGAFEEQAQVDAVDARIDSRAEPSAVLVRLSADDEGALSGAMGALEDHAEEHQLTVLEEVQGGHDV